jgi:hypothetical protein
VLGERAPGIAREPEYRPVAVAGVTDAYAVIQVAGFGAIVSGRAAVGRFPPASIYVSHRSLANRSSRSREVVAVIASV